MIFFLLLQLALPQLVAGAQFPFNFATTAAAAGAPHMAGFYYPQPMSAAAAQAAAAQTNYLQGLQGYTFNNFGTSFPQGYIRYNPISLMSDPKCNWLPYSNNGGLPGMQVAAASYGVPNQSTAAAVTAATAGQIGPSQAALAAQGLAATQQPTAAAAAATAGVVHMPYTPSAAAAAASAVQQFQMNGQPTTLAL